MSEPRTEALVSDAMTKASLSMDVASAEIDRLRARVAELEAEAALPSVAQKMLMDVAQQAANMGPCSQTHHEYIARDAQDALRDALRVQGSPPAVHPG